MTNTTIDITLPAFLRTRGSTAAAVLKRLLRELIALGLDAKQALWTGPAFLPLHTLTDEIKNDVAVWADRVAERATALGSPVDGRPATVAETAGDPGHLICRPA